MAATFVWLTKLSKDGWGGGVSLLGMVPVDYSLKRYRSTEKMKDKLLPLDKSHVQRVVKDKNPIPRDSRNACKAIECHRG